MKLLITTLFIVSSWAMILRMIMDVVIPTLYVFFSCIYRLPQPILAVFINVVMSHNTTQQDTRI